MNIVNYKPDRCPHCSVAAPHFSVVHGPFQPAARDGAAKKAIWAVWSCSVCGGVVLLRGDATAKLVVETYPPSKRAHADIPLPARTYLQQAFETLHAPDAAAVMAGSAVDAMLKNRGYDKGSLYDRIDKARDDHLLTEAMATWAHEVRLGSNRPRHADADKPHVSPEEAKQSVEFAEALAHFLFVLSARITRGIETAKAATAE